MFILDVYKRCASPRKKLDKISSWNFILGLFHTQGSRYFRSFSTPGSVFLASNLPEGIFWWSWDFAKMFFGCFKCQFQSFMMIGWVLDYEIFTKKWLERLKNGSKVTFLSLTSHFFVKFGNRKLIQLSWNSGIDILAKSQLQQKIPSSSFDAKNTLPGVLELRKYREPWMRV